MQPWTFVTEGMSTISAHSGACKGKATLSLGLIMHYAMKSHGGSGGVALPVLTSALEGVSIQLHAPAALPPGKQPPTPVV
jgi:hypothetical protein